MSLEEKVYELVETVKIPNLLFPDHCGQEFASLFDYATNGEEDEEGIILVDKLLALIASEKAKAVKQALETTKKEIDELPIATVGNSAATIQQVVSYLNAKINELLEDSK